MGEKTPFNPLEKSKEDAFNRAERMAENLRKLEKSVISEVDEATQAARGAITAMGFGINPVAQVQEDTDEDS
jgi:hypothetical protein